MKNKLAYLGFLGFFSLLSPFNPIFFSMFSFFFFFLYAKVIPDELFILHVQRSAARAFITGLVLAAPILNLSFIIEKTSIIRFLFILSFIVPLMTFIISLELFERKEKKALNSDF